jgi:hypothetical protein
MPPSRTGNVLRGQLAEPNQRKKPADENETRTV